MANFFTTGSRQCHAKGRAEPYAWVSNIVGPDNPRFGWANVEQITGTAPWMDIAATQYLLGLRPSLTGLIIDPCLPPDWPGYTGERLFQGCRLRIIVKNLSGSSKGVRRLLLDGKELPQPTSGMIPAYLLANRQHAEVIAEM